MVGLNTTVALEIAKMAMISASQIASIASLSEDLQVSLQSSIDLATIAMQLAAKDIYSGLLYRTPIKITNKVICEPQPKTNGKKHNFQSVGAFPSGFRVLGGIDEVLGNSESPRATKVNGYEHNNKVQQVNRCKALLLEILRRAAHDWILYRQHKKMAMREIASDAYTWLFEESEKHQNWKLRCDSSVICDGEEVEGVKTLTSFLSVCEALELDPKTVRERVKKMDVHMIISAGRPAETRKYKHEDLVPPEECKIFVDVDEYIKLENEDSDEDFGFNELQINKSGFHFSDI